MNMQQPYNGMPYNEMQGMPNNGMMNGMPVQGPMNGVPFDASQGQPPMMYGMNTTSPVPHAPVMPDGSKRPTGGIVAQKLKMNPYLSMSGNYRKPRQDEMIREIQLFKGITASGRAARVSDINNKIRHCCITKPYFHVLSAEKYRVILPNNEIEIIYYVHRECNTLIVAADTLSE